MRKLIAAAAAALVSTVGLTACDGHTATAADKAVSHERGTRQASYTQTVKNQPAHMMEFSPTRRTINKWSETWDDPSALAYTYIKDQDGSVGYYVFLGPPVSYAVSITPTYDKAKIDCGEYCSETIVPAPGIDAAYYNGSGANMFYGIDAVSGGIVTFSVGQGQNMQYFSQPNSRYKNAEPLGDATIAAAKKKEQ